MGGRQIDQQRVDGFGSEEPVRRQLKLFNAPVARLPSDRIDGSTILAAKALLQSSRLRAQLHVKPGD
jgi:hypothetical protein